MTVTAQQQKSELRQKIRAALEKISPAVRAVESIELCERLEAQLRSAHTILFFAPMPEEPDIWPLLEKFLAMGKCCGLPFFDTATKNYLARRVQNLRKTFPRGISASGNPLQAARKFRWKHLIWFSCPAWHLIGTATGWGAAGVFTTGCWQN